MGRSKGGIAVLVALTAGFAALVGPAEASSTASADPCAAPLPQGSEPVTLDPANFVGTIDNAYWPMTPGSTWIYQETDRRGHVKRVKVQVADRTRPILGIAATVVHDTLSNSKGSVLEDTWDWYAQDVCGNIWYLGENTKEFKSGQVVSTEGSWEAGVDGAQAGVALPATPTVGQSYRQEYYAGQAEDSGSILSVAEQDRVPYGHFSNVVLTHDSTTLEPRVLEYKFYAQGVGPVEEIGISGGADRTELLTFNAG